ncbi:hypothetical protein QE152_g4349 [Popillia japonica]|uniref:Uncharacterized protein n=1 Tax=Popillia japonica TaxID=7064 RepID=A0AAW1MW85_POPJA
MGATLEDVKELYNEVKVFKSNISKDNQERRKNVELSRRRLIDLEQFLVKLSELELELSKHAENIEVVSNIKIYSAGIRNIILETRILLESRLDIEVKMETFSLKTASSLLPSMDGNEDTTKQLIDSAKLYETLLKPEEKKHLINYILKKKLLINYILKTFVRKR